MYSIAKPHFSSVFIVTHQQLANIHVDLTLYSRSSSPGWRFIPQMQ